MAGIFDPRWVTHHRPTVASAELAEVKITRVLNQGEWSPEFGLTGGTELVLYEGKARWQKVGYPTKRDHVADSANFQRVRVQVQVERVSKYQTDHGIEYAFQPNDKVTLTRNDSMPSSEGSTVYVWGDATSSNAWHHSLTCQQNMKQDG